MQTLHQAVLQACERLRLGSTISKVTRPMIASLSCKVNHGLKINGFGELLNIFQVIVMSSWFCCREMKTALSLH